MNRVGNDPVHAEHAMPPTILAVVQQHTRSEGANTPGVDPVSLAYGLVERGGGVRRKNVSACKSNAVTEKVTDVIEPLAEWQPRI